MERSQKLLRIHSFLQSEKKARLHLSRVSLVAVRQSSSDISNGKIRLSSGRCQDQILEHQLCPDKTQLVLEKVKKFEPQWLAKWRLLFYSNSGW